MTTINRLIAQAKAGATELLLPENHIGSVAQHMEDTTACYASAGAITRDAAEDALRRGTVKMLGVPVRVVPAAPDTQGKP